VDRAAAVEPPEDVRPAAAYHRARLAERYPLAVTTTPYAFDRATEALADLAADRVDGAAVLRLP
jgi:hypothetical protein